MMPWSHRTSLTRKAALVPVAAAVVGQVVEPAAGHGHHQVRGVLKL